MYVSRNIETPSRNLFCLRKPVSITYMNVLVSRPSSTACRAHAPYYIVVCGFSSSTMCSHIIS